MIWGSFNNENLKNQFSIKKISIRYVPFFKNCKEKFKMRFSRLEVLFYLLLALNFIIYPILNNVGLDVPNTIPLFYVRMGIGCTIHVSWFAVATLRLIRDYNLL